MRGVYRYIPRDRREVVECAHWDDIPAEIDELVCFRPAIPDEPNCELEQQMIETLGAKFWELRARCRR